MDKRGFNLVKDFFPKEISLGKPHPATCGCDICQSCDDIFDDLSKISKNLFSQKVKTSNTDKICKFLDRESLESLNCVNAVESEGLLGNLKEIWERDIEGKPIGNLNTVHEDSCSCLLCSVKNELLSKFEELYSSKSLDDDILEILQGNKWDDEEVSDQASSSQEEVNNEINKEDEEKQYLICEQNKPILLTVKNGTVLSAVDVNSCSEMMSEKQSATPSKEGDKCVMTNVDYFDLTGLNEEEKSEPVDISNTQNTTLKEIQLDELVDICLCEPGKLSPYCLKHSVAYCQHMQTKLYEEGCTCTHQTECLLCQRLKCNFCSHERSVPACSFMVDEESDDVAMKVSSWLDSKLLEVGVKPEIIDQLNESMPKVKSDETAKEVIPGSEELSDLLADHIGRSLLDSPMLNSVPLECNFTITSEMESDILNMNELFDIRSYPRCYRLKGIKNDKGIYTDIDEEFMEVGFNAWKVPTQFIEETVPLASADPDLEARLDKEEDIRRRTKTQKAVLNQQRVCIKGLTDDWQPIIEICPDDSDYNEVSTEEEKESWAQKTYEEIMEKCRNSMEPKEVNETWSRVQPILDKYCEENPPEMNKSPGLLAAQISDFDSFLEDTMKSAEKIIKKFPCNTIGYKPEFWKGLEDWRPDKTENEVHKCLIDEVKKLSKELDSFKNDFERILIKNPGDPVDPEAVLNSIISKLPEELASEINRIKSQLPANLLNNPESALIELEKSSSKQIDELLMKKINKLRTRSESKSESFSSHKLSESGGNERESFHDSDEEFQDIIGKPEAYFYDDEEVMDDVIELEDSKTEDVSITTAKNGETMKEITSIQSTFKGTSSKGFKSASLLPHTPAPFVEKLKEEMLKNNPDGLHPVQQLWYDRPMFPFWTPTVVYDLSDLEKTLLSDVPEYSPEISDIQLKELEKKLLNYDCKQSSDDKSPIKINNTLKNLSLDSPELSITPDSIDSSIIELKNTTVIETDVVKDNDDDKDKKSLKSMKKTASDDDCLIKEDDFKLVIEQMLKAQEMKKETVKNDSEDAGGALGREQILKGIAGKVISQKDGAVELDTRQEIDLESIVPHPALKYPFKLDIFQKQAIIALEAGLSVFVSAHTSAGKTVAAEYAIAMAQRNGCRVVYTSPIKALSNQKYNDFTKKFKGNIKVGIITGDVQLNRDAECLIMTTEILRSMLYNQSSILSDLEFVVFDEVHYFNDPERGNVWEEVLILLPQQCQLIMLSATVPNVMNFASWVGSLRKRTVIVASTTKRPVPLKHYIHFSTEPKYIEKVLPLKDAEGPFLSDNFADAMKFKTALSSGRYQERFQANQMWERFINKHLKRHQRLPVVIFCFSRKRCDDLAMGIRSIDLVQDAKERAHIEHFIARQINMLQPEDRDIKQIVTMKTLLTRGIGVHHSGMLPILKEIVEVLFSKSQIKLLFATETFAMGVNMPAKTVVFQQTRKFDGIAHRALKPAEYTQMAGRAGRRGIDKSGTVIITEWNKPDKCVDEIDLNNMLTGDVDPLQSQFRLRYSMILTALKPEGENSIQAIIGKSFFNFSCKAQRNLAEILKERGDKCLTEIAEEMRMIPPGLRECLSDYCNITHQLFSLHDTIRDKMFEHRSIKSYLTCGRLVTICYKKYVNIFGIIVGVDKVGSNKTTYDIAVMRNSQFWIQPLKTRYQEATQEDEENWYRLVGFRKMELLPLNQLCRNEIQDTLELLHCKANNICRIVKNGVFKLNKNEAQTICESLKNPKMYYPNQILKSLMYFFTDCLKNMHNFICLEEDFHFNDENLRKEVLKYHKVSQAFTENLNNVRLNRTEDDYRLLHYLETCFWFYEMKKKEDRRKVEAQKEELKWLFKDFESKLIFLKNNKYIKEDDDVVDTKGRIASRMTNFEVFVTEILLRNVLEELDGAETAALLSCLILPGVNTDVTEDSNQENPLFEPIVEAGIKIDPNQQGPATGNSKKIRKDFEKAELNKAVTKINAKMEKIKDKNQLIKRYLELTPPLLKAIDDVKLIISDLILQEEELGIEPMEGADLNKVTFCLVPIVYAWAKGRPVTEIMDVLGRNIQEGILVRWIINLHETIKDIDSATHHFLRDSRIKMKFETAIASIKRGIIDMPSLYLNQRSQPTE